MLYLKKVQVRKESVSWSGDTKVYKFELPNACILYHVKLEKIESPVFCNTKFQ